MDEAATKVLRGRMAAAYAARNLPGVFELLMAAGDPATHRSEVLGIGINAALLHRDFNKAIAWLSVLREREPHDLKVRHALSMAHNNRGVALRANEAVAAARADYEAALAAWPDNSEALFNLATADLDALQPERARTHLLRLRALHPADREIELLELESRLATGDESAQPALRNLLRGDADSKLPVLVRCKAQVLAEVPIDIPALRSVGAATPSERTQLAAALCESGRWREARSVYADLAEDLENGARSPGLYATFGAHLALPSVVEDRSELEAADAAYSTGLVDLESLLTDAALARCEPGLAQVRWCDIAAAHRTGNLRQAQQSLGNLLARAGAALARGYAPAVSRDLPRRPRVGFVGQCFRNCAGGAYFGSWIKAIGDAGFETHLFQIGPKYDAWTTAFEADAEYSARLDDALDAMASEIAGRQLDLIIYPELGGNHRVQALATLRLAPRQICAWGVPVTSGLPTIDAFVTCAAMEPPHAAEHYSERLIGLPHIGTLYRPPVVPTLRSRSELGLPETARLYFTPHAPLKLHVDGDATLAEIAASDPAARIVLFRPYHHGAFHRLRSRLARALVVAGADPARLIFLPTGSRERYLQIAAACDVMVDSPHWSGGNSTLDCLIMNLPVVTLAGECMRGRQSMGMVELLGLSSELVCDDRSEQAARAVEVATNADLGAHVRRTLVARASHLFAGQSALLALQDVVRELIEQRPG